MAIPRREVQTSIKVQEGGLGLIPVHDDEDESDDADENAADAPEDVFLEGDDEDLDAEPEPDDGADSVKNVSENFHGDVRMWLVVVW